MSPVLGLAVPPGHVHSPTTKCPVSGQDVPTKYQRCLSSNGKVGTGPENKAGSIHQSFVENFMVCTCSHVVLLLSSNFIPINNR